MTKTNGAYLFLVLLAFGILMLTIHDALRSPRIETKIVASKVITTKMTYDQVRKRFSSPTEGLLHIDGTKMGLPAGTFCDGWASEGKGWLNLLCYTNS